MTKNELANDLIRHIGVMARRLEQAGKPCWELHDDMLDTVFTLAEGKAEDSGTD